MMTKKSVLIVSVIGVVLFILGILFLMNDVCSVDAWVKCRIVDKSVNMLVDLLMFAIPAFLFSLLTYFLHEKVFRAWLRFTYWWIPLSFAIVLFSSSRPSANIVGISDQEIFGVLTWGLYIIISLIIIAWKYFSTRSKPMVRV